jgi:serine/threonine protein phosphatase 1
MFRFRKAAAPTPATRLEPFAATTPEGALIYVIGDIHGRADLLHRLIAMLRTDSAERCEGHRPILMFLGDYVDRGPASRQVLDELIKLRSDPWFKLFALCGNHDQFFLGFLERPQLGARPG